MTPEKNQNSDLPLQLPPEIQKRQEQQQALQSRLQELRSLESQVKYPGKKEKNDGWIDLQLHFARLEKKISGLDLKNQEIFDIQVQKINEQLHTLEIARAQTAQLHHQVLGTHAQRLQQLNSQLSAHHPQANYVRVQSYETIAGIKPQAGENIVANWAASWIERLIA